MDKTTSKFDKSNNNNNNNSKFSLLKFINFLLIIN